MSGGLRCRCNKPDWVVAHRRCNCSAFNGYRWTPSNYSEVQCLHCGVRWRTKAKYVDKLRDDVEEI